MEAFETVFWFFMILILWGLTLWGIRLYLRIRRQIRYVDEIIKWAEEVLERGPPKNP